MLSKIIKTENYVYSMVVFIKNTHKLRHSKIWGIIFLYN